MYKTTTTTTHPNPPGLLTFPIIATKSLPLDTSQLFFEDQFGHRMEVEVVDDAPTAGVSCEGPAAVPSKKMMKGGKVKNKKGIQIKKKKGEQTKAKKKASDAIELTEEEERGNNLVETGLDFNQTLVQF